MRYFLIILGVLLLSTSTYSQELQEVVYLKNGSIIRGAIIEQVPGKTIKIQTADGSVFVYQTDEVEKITKEPNQLMTKESRENSLQYEGSVFIGASPTIRSIETHYSYNTRGTLFGLTTSHGVKISSQSTISLGIGYETLTDGSEDEFYKVSLVPIYVDVRFFFSETAIKPYVFGNVGYSYGSTIDHTLYYISDGDSTETNEFNSGFIGQGVMYFIGIGGRFQGDSQMGVNFEVGYRAQELQGKTLQMVGMRLGVSF